MCVCVCVCVCAELCSAVCDLMNWTVSSVHGIFQERILEWVVLTKKYSHNLKVERYFIWWDCPQPWRQHLSSSEKTAPRRKEGESDYTPLQQREQAGWTSKSDIKLRSLAFSVWEDASLWTHWIHSFHMHLGYLGPNLVSLFFLRRGKCDKWLLLAFPHWGYGSICWIAVLGVPAPPTPFNIWRPEIADGCDISCLLIWQEMFSFYSCYLLLPGIFLTQWWNSSLLHLLPWQAGSLPLSHLFPNSCSLCQCVTAGRWLRMNREIVAGPGGRKSHVT